MSKDEALRLALEALEFDSFYGTGKKETITAIKAALEAKDEPVAYVETKEVHGQMCSFIYRADSTKLLPDGTKLYIAPPQRKPLTDEEIDELSHSMVRGDKSVNWLCRAIERKHGIYAPTERKGEA